jgi:acetyltransferase-like isoleucine patch superfamily enzyme
MSKKNEFKRYLLENKLPGIFYERVFINTIPECIGKFSLLFYKLLYRNLHIGKHVRCWGKPIIAKSPDSFISFGNNVRIGSDFLRAGIALFSRCKIQAYSQAKISIGNNCALTGTSITCRTTSIRIGDGTIIGPNVIIVDSDFHSIWPPENRTYSMGYENDRSVVIGRNVWIGLNSIILKGVTIGDNSVIAAGSIVVKDIPANVVAAGNPASVIKSLP